MTNGNSFSLDWLNLVDEKWVDCLNIGFHIGHTVGRGREGMNLELLTNRTCFFPKNVRLLTIRRRVLLSIHRCGHKEFTLSMVPQKKVPLTK